MRDSFMAGARGSALLLATSTVAMTMGLGIAPAVADEEGPSSWVYLESGDPDGIRSGWWIDNDVLTGDGTPTGTGCRTGAGLGVDDAAYDVYGEGNQDDAFDVGLAFYVSGRQLVAPLDWSTDVEVDESDTPRAVAVGPMSVPGGVATVEYRAMPDQQVLRSVVSVTNASSEPRMVPVTVATNLGSDYGTRLVGTSSGDTVLTDDDRWVVTADGDDVVNDAVNTHVLAGPGEVSEPPTAVSSEVFECSGPQGVAATYDLYLEPGDSQSLMFFNELSPSGASAVESAVRFDENPAVGDELLTGLAPEELATIANWAFGDPTPAPTPAPAPAPSDHTPPQSALSAPTAWTSGPWAITYTASDRGFGVRRVELFAQRPGSDEFVLVGTDDASHLDGRFDFDPRGVDGSYAFYTVATDHAGNREAVPQTPDGTTFFDDSAPASVVATSPLTDTATIPVRYAVEDAGLGADVASVDLYVRGPGAEAFVKVQSDTGAALDGRFSYLAVQEGAYRFYTRATDTLGNTEPVPARTSRTRLDTTAPEISGRMLGRVLRLELGKGAPLVLAGRLSESGTVSVVVRQAGEPVQELAPSAVQRGRFTRSWNGKDADGRRVTPGRYVVRLAATDRAGNTAVLRIPVRVTR